MNHKTTYNYTLCGLKHEQRITTNNEIQPTGYNVVLYSYLLMTMHYEIKYITSDTTIMEMLIGYLDV